MATVDLIILLIPASILISSFTAEVSLVHFIGISMALVYAIIYGWYAHRVWNKGAFFGALLWPVLVLQEIILVIASVIQYQRRTVKWKGRKVLVSRQFKAK